MNKIQKRALSIKKVFGCSQNEADAFALDIEKAEGEPNGRIGNFEEITESKSHETEIQNENVIKMRAKARAGIKSFRNHDETDELKSRIAYLGGVRL